MKRNTLIAFGISTAIVGVASVLIFKKLFSKKAKLIKKAIYEWQGFGEPTYKNGRLINKGGKEEAKGFAERINLYWKEGVGLNYSGKDKDVAWSSAFISFIMKLAGYGKDFVYSASHSNYITKFIDNRKKGKTDETFVGYRLNEKPYEVGDLVCYSRQSGVNYDTTGNYMSHCDLIVKKNDDSLEVIGGNVGDSVSKKILALDKFGNLADRNHKWFAHIVNNS